MKIIDKRTSKDFQNGYRHAIVKSVEIANNYSLRKDNGEMFRKAKAIIWLKTEDIKPITVTMRFNVPPVIHCYALENYITSNLDYYYPGDFKSANDYLQAVFDGTCMLIDERAKTA